MMMMEKPKQDEEENKHQEESSSTTKKSTDDQIIEIERRINRLGNSKKGIEETKTKVKTKPVQNNDLLARIKAAQQRAKEAQLQQEQLEEQKEEQTFLASLSKEITDDDDIESPILPPSFDVIEEQEQTNEPAPPTFDVLEQHQAPPTFDEMEIHDQTESQSLPPPSFDTITSNPEMVVLGDTNDNNVIPSAPDFIQEEEKEQEETIDFSSLYPHISLTDEQQQQNQDQQQPYNMKELQKVIYDEQLRILEEIKTNSSDINNVTTSQNNTETSHQQIEHQPENATIMQPPPPPQQTIQIAPDHHVPLHGPESTRSAITEGTAVLTQCCNCKSYLHITNTATLMYCPCCQVVSPVTTINSTNDIHSNQNDLSRQQEDLDRQLAQRMQDEEYTSSNTYPTRQMRVTNNSSGGWMSSLFGTSVTDYPRGANRTNAQQPLQQQQESQESWSEYFTSFIGSTSSTNTITNNINDDDDEAQLYQALTGTNEDENNIDTRLQTSLPPAVVANRKPVYDCIVEGATSIADSATTMLAGNNSNENEYHGVDTSCLLEDESKEAISNATTNTNIVIGGSSKSKSESNDQYHLLE